MVGQRDILILIANKLDQYRIPYLLTGSFAVAYHGYPRATHDIDFIIEIYSDKSQLLINAISDLKKYFIFDKKQINQEINRKGMFDIFNPDSGIKVDFWLVKSDFDKNKFKRGKKITINKQKINLISSEDLLLTKLLWCKTIRSERHLRDSAGIWQIQKDKIDVNYLNLWAKKLSVKNLLMEIKEMRY